MGQSLFEFLACFLLAMSATESSEYRRSRQSIAPFCRWYLHLGRLRHNQHFKVIQKTWIQYQRCLSLTSSITSKPTILSTSPSQIRARNTFKLIDNQVFAHYQDQRFGLVTLIDRRTAFHQHPKNTTFFQSAVVEGWKTMGFEEPVLPIDWWIVLPHRVQPNRSMTPSFYWNILW